MKRAVAAALRRSSLRRHSLAAQAAPPAAPKPRARPARPEDARPPLDFTGVWVLDAEGQPAASRSTWSNAVPLGPPEREPDLDRADRAAAAQHPGRADRRRRQAVREGARARAEGHRSRPSGARTAQSLWLQASPGPRRIRAPPCSEWSGGSRTAARPGRGRPRTIQPDGTRDTFLVFRKREARSRGGRLRRRLSLRPSASDRPRCTDRSVQGAAPARRGRRRRRPAGKSTCARPTKAAGVRRIELATPAR